MTQKEKAKELVDKCLPFVECNFTNSNSEINNAKQCALIAVELHLQELSKMKLIFSDRELHYKFWQQVKQEIEKL